MSPKSPAAVVRAEIERRLGRVPAFFEPAFANPDVLRELWRQTRLDWLDSPVPISLRHALLEALGEHSPWPWAVVAEAAGHRPSGSSPDVAALLEAPLQRPPPPAAGRPLEDWPETGTPEYDELLSLTLRMVLDGSDEEVGRRVLGLLGERRYASLLAVLTYLETCRTFAQAHPGLAAAGSPRYRRTRDPRELVIIEIDQDGAITSFSPAAEDLFGYAAPSVIGRRFAELVAEEARGTLERLIDEFGQEKGAPVREQSFRIVGRRRDHSAFNAALTLANRGREGHQDAMTAIVDVQRAAGRPDHAAAYRALLNLLEGGASTLSPDAALAAIAQALGWEYILVWRLAPDESALRCVAVRGLDGDFSAEVEKRASATVIPGEGTVGKVFQSGAPAWVEDLATSESTGLASGLWLPVWSMGKIDGVVELLAATHRRSDPALLEMFSTLARDAEELLAPDAATGRQQPRPEPADAISRARLAFEGAPVGMALVTVDPAGAGAITEANRAMCVLTGRTARELRDLSIADITDPEDLELDAELMSQLLAGQIPSYEVAKRFRRADSQSFWGELSVSLIRADDDERRPLYLVIQLADISERKRVEEALHVSRDRIASVFEEAPMGMALATLDGRWLQVNDAFCQILGHSEADLLGKSLSDLLAPEEVETIERYLRQLLAGEVLGYHVETRALTADADVVWVQLSVSLVHDYDGAPAYVFAEMQDVSERKRLEDELEQGALLDASTGLPSRTLLFDRLEQARARLERTGTPFVVMFAAVQGLDAVASEFGRERADSALREIAARLVAAVRSGDTVARYEGDEFVIVSEDLESHGEAGVIASRILDFARFTVGEGETGVELSVIVGITVAATHADSSAALVERADAAMHLARSEGAEYQEYSDSL